MRSTHYVEKIPRGYYPRVVWSSMVKQGKAFLQFTTYCRSGLKLWPSIAASQTTESIIQRLVTVEAFTWSAICGVIKCLFHPMPNYSTPNAIYSPGLSHEPFLLLKLHNYTRGSLRAILSRIHGLLSGLGHVVIKRSLGVGRESLDVC